MSRRLEYVFSAVLLPLLSACEQEITAIELDACEAVRRAPDLRGKQVKVNGVYESMGGFWSAIGSAECPGTLIEPDFSTEVEIAMPQANDRFVRQLRNALASDVPPAMDFEGRFYGTLIKRTGHPHSGPVPLDAPPNINQMPYVLKIARIDSIQNVGEAAPNEQSLPPSR